MTSFRSSPSGNLVEGFIIPSNGPQGTQTIVSDGAFGWMLAAFGGSGSQGPQGAQGAQGTQGPSGSNYVYAQKLYVSKAAPAGGDGSPGKPFKTLAAGIAAAPAPVLGVVQPCVLMLAPGDDYSSEGTISYSDKAITFYGMGLLNLSGITFTHGIFIRVTSTGDAALGTTIVGCNSQFQPNSHNLSILLFNAYCEQNGDGTHAANVYMFGATPILNRSGGNGLFPQIGALNLDGGSFGNATVRGDAQVINGELSGDYLILENLSVEESIFQNTKLVAGSVETHHPLSIYDCRFPRDATSVVISTADSGSIITDRATYARGVLSGVTWPNDTELIENTPVPPQYIGTGTGQNLNVDAKGDYYDNVLGDTFIARITCVGAQVPVTLTGWSQIGAPVNVGTLTHYEYVRDARSSGGETGTVTFVVPAGNFVNSMVIDTWRYVATGAISDFIENITQDDSTDPGGFIAGPTVMPGGVARTAVTCIASNGVYPPNPTAITGGVTGGTWISRNGFGSGLGGGSGLQTAALNATDPVTGGSSTASVGGGTQYVVMLSYALVGTSFLDGGSGSQGPQGAQGASGVQGPQGSSGAQGPQGASGSGAQGDAGAVLWWGAAQLPDDGDFLTPFDYSTDGTLSPFTTILYAPRDGVIGNALFGIGNTEGADTTATLTKNGSDTTIVATILNGESIGYDTTHTVSVVKGDALRVRVDGNAGGNNPQFQVVYLGGAGEMVPLTRDFYVDSGRTTSGENGSEGDPFKTIQAGVDAVAAAGGSGAVLIADGDYSAEDVTIAGRTTLRGIGYGKIVGAAGVRINSVTISDGSVVVELENVNVGQITCTGSTLHLTNVESTSPMTIDSTNLRAINSTLGSMTGTNVGGGNPTVYLQNSTCSSITASAGTVQLINSLASGNIDTDVLSLNESSATALTAGTLSLRNSDASSVTLGTSLSTDSYSLTSLRLAGGTNTIPALTITDRPLFTGVSFTVPTLAAAMSDVTAALVGARPGDTFDVAMSTRLAGVGIVGAWCAADDVLTVRFFGTTGGGSVILDVNLNVNSG